MSENTEKQTEQNIDAEQGDIMVSEEMQLYYPKDGNFHLTLGLLRQRHTNLSIGSSLPESFLNDLGYYVVHRSEKPKGADVVTEVLPNLVGGKFYQQYTTRSFNEEELRQIEKNRKRQEVDNFKAEKMNSISSGVPVALKDGNYNFPVTAEFLNNISHILAAGYPDSKVTYLRDASNKVVKVSTVKDLKKIHVAVFKALHECENSVLEKEYSVYQSV